MRNEAFGFNCEAVPPCESALSWLLYFAGEGDAALWENNESPSIVLPTTDMRSFS